MQRETQLVFLVCMFVCVCVYACLVFIEWQAILEQGVQHEDKWDRIKRVPARQHRLDSASWKKKKKRAERIVADKEGGPQSDTGGSHSLYSHCITQAFTQTRVQTSLLIHFRARTHTHPHTE